MELKSTVCNALYRDTRALSAALGLRDQSTQFHSERVCGLAAQIGEKCELSEFDLGILQIAASFHDVGKIGIPDQILMKSTKFDDAEWARMKQHAEMGEQIILATKMEGAKQASLAIRHHHEYFNGKGYPDCMSGKEIPVLSRIISIADSYDAMAEVRSYHRPRTHDEIMATLHAENGEKFDPSMMKIFDALIDRSQYKTTFV